MLDKLEPSLQRHLQTNFTPPLTSSHKSFEREVKIFVDKYFPEHFGSYRELAAAQLFRKRLQENAVWDKFLTWCCEHVDFRKAAELDNGVVFKILSAVVRKFLGSADFKNSSKSDGIFTWADLVPRLTKHQRADLIEII